jgi:hypothetical protein
VTGPPSAPPAFTTSIRLPPHRLDIDEAKFLRLLCHCPCLTKAEKRRIIEAIPRLQQYQADGLIEIWEEEAEAIRKDTPHRANWARVRAADEREWRELERELSH